ncbi:MAG: hypothetical protein A3H57_03855 [Candidatus Taylorbacteria bacterium RIFCSPLOWO2_02_FULL_43_11]|uniref:Transcriptional repressor PaaX-like central Cas2-like domain-containing protein n=1 Tax=Candidatus Taylorbacteria bacterium RIFCSPHIGHO2_02_FULL_43_32b TaxID=1802306 RepID=A0A1G2MJH2_9BACT|nr:MAG: hypothetical protein A2743_01330 [Candidatus Taylorbacteria bacterium RIFCSPHIGHO2_01_FULL_43_47]OHA24065.1 MAG: hypothetical protein A3C72_02935 [Candidatus Taylorbacteria bacterium RIFCSPHIGHO2_02_FULL_43_32b]OHA31471.1 MAG: hypothetical protein A3B08_00810 [Candidatus Taylorbacteria bacterium RIFCSPLOWO2_01_FULL_43_44]OHA37522.1 MAG: hypothetical protein A3H57_03855 [Candidatus Taylorbacteria bacterium RIFCSPLOWO2_02_FULL_43_11]
MGNIEFEAKKIRTRRSIRKAILASIAVAGFLSIAAVAPNAMSILELVSGKKKKTPKFAITNSFNRLLESGYIELKNKGGQKKVEITGKGRLLLARIGGGNYVLKKPWRWDKRWRIILFDIPENRRPVRVKLWKMLRALHFYPMQDSAWVYPYDCEDVIKLIKTDLHVSFGVIYIIAESIENDRRIRDFFGLNKNLKHLKKIAAFITS